MMRRFVPGLLLLLASPLFPQALSQGDRDFALSALHASRKLFLDTVAGLSDAQLDFKPAPGAWSIRQIAEHITVTEDAIPRVAQQALKAPATPEKRSANPRTTDESLLRTVPLREKKMQAPEFLKPSGRFKTMDELTAAFRTARDRNIAYVRDTQDDLRDHFAPHPAFGDLDSLQWYILIGAHTERHLNQMKEVMADPGYPKN